MTMSSSAPPDLYAVYVVLFDDVSVQTGRLVEGRHQCRRLVAVRQAQTVAELVRGHGEQVEALPVGDRVYLPRLALVEVGVSAEYWEKGVCQGAAGTVERVTVTVITVLKPVRVRPGQSHVPT